MRKLIGVLLLNLILFCSFVDAQSPIPIAYFGIHYNKTTGWPPLPSGTLRLWDSGTNWFHVETSAGVYNFSRLDGFITEANNNGLCDGTGHNCEIIYNPSTTPTFYSSNSGDTTCSYAAGGCWPPTDINSGNTHFKNFLTAVINHIGPGVIKYWEGWNEPNNSFFWSGTVADLKTMQTTLYNTVHQLDPSAKVLMPAGFSCSGQNCIQSFLSNGFGAISDINVYHGKRCVPEDIIAYDANIISLFTGNATTAGRPIWNTEGGWGGNSKCTDSANYPNKVARLQLLSHSNGIGRYYWYAYDNTAWGTLGSGQTLNSAGIAYKQVSNWMVGANGGACTSAGNIFTCTFNRTSPAGYVSKAVWYTAGSIAFSVPAGFTDYLTLTGSKVTVTPGQSITLDGFPILLESTSGTPTSPAPPTGLTAIVQ